MKKHNGEIDLLRLLFALIICFGHWYEAATGKIIGFFYLGVEFFFILSGYFMAVSGSKAAENGLGLRETGDRTWSFLGRKIKAFYRYYFVAVLLRFVVRYLVIERCGIRNAVGYLLKSPSVFSLTFLTLDMQNQPLYVGASWYLSGMLFALLLLYPVLLKFGNTALKVIFPLLSLGIFGYFIGNGIALTQWNTWSGICYYGMLRAIADVSLGAVLFPLSRALAGVLEKIDGGRLTGVLAAVIKYGLWALILTASFKKFVFREIDIVFYIALAVMLSFAVPKYSIKESKLTKTASKLSLGIYVFHCVFRDVIRSLTDITQADIKKIVVFCAVSVVGSVLLTYLTDVVFAAAGKLIKKMAAKKDANA